MSSIRSTPEQAEAKAAPTVAVAEATSITRSSSPARSQVSRRQIAGRFVLTWAIAFLALRPWSGVEATFGQAVLVTTTWLLLAHWTAQTFRSMTFAIGPFAVAAATSGWGVATISALGFWIPGIGINHSSLALIAVLTFLLSGSWDHVVQWAAHAPRRVLVVGGGPPTARLLDDLARDRDAALEVIAIVDDSLDPAIDSSVTYGGALRNLPAAVRRFTPDLVVVAVPYGRPEVFAQLLGVADEGFQVVGLPEVYEFSFGRLPIEDLTSAWFMSVLHAYNRPSNRLAKRVFDIVVALIAAVVALPLLPVIAVLVKLTPGPLLYRQRRLGENGRTFTMLKFRSMHRDAEKAGQAQWASTNDPRIIPGGRILRLLRLDELPQIWNVLVGDMSIVGPRPERPEFLDHLEAEVPFWTHRHLLKPGITGWAQIRAGYAADALGTVEKLSYDLWYLRHRSLMLDAMICLKTLPRMATFGGAR